MNTIRVPGCPTYSGPQHEAVPDAGDKSSAIMLDRYLLDEGEDCDIDIKGSILDKGKLDREDCSEEDIGEEDMGVR